MTPDAFSLTPVLMCSAIDAAASMHQQVARWRNGSA